MRRIIVCLTFFVAWGTAVADDAAEAEAKVREYFEVFNAQDIDGILERIYSIPVHVGNGAGHSAYGSPAEARKNLGALYPQIRKQGWVESVISNVDACVIADGLVFAEVTYTRDKADGEAIAPGPRSNVYVVQKLEPGWRITAFYGRDMDKGFDCDG